jgi:hypothetical protein
MQITGDYLKSVAVGSAQSRSGDAVRKPLAQYALFCSAS